jgi:hypothetical protein
VLAVDWKAITRGKSMATNHRIAAGDMLVIRPQNDR